MNDCDACNTGTASTEKCSAKGVAVCDGAYENLPTTPQMKIIGVNGECIYEFQAPGNNAMIVWDESTGWMNLTNDIDCDIPRQGDDSTPGTFDYIMVLEGTTWRKWKGPSGTSGFIFWDHTLGVWQFGQMNESGICTEAVLADVADTGWWPVFDESVDTTAAGTKCIKRLTSDAADLFYLDSDFKLKRVNSGNGAGFVVFEAADPPCDGSNIPKVKQLCDIAAPPCETAPELVNFVGCASDGKVAKTSVTPVANANGCGFAAMSAGNGAKFENIQLGRTVWPGAHGTARSGAALNTNQNETILDTEIATALGYTPPGTITHVIFRVDLTLRTTVGTLRTLVMSLGGIVAARLEAYSWDAATEDQRSVVANILVPVSGGNVALTTTLSSGFSTDYDYTAQVAGALVCPAYS